MRTRRTFDLCRTVATQGHCREGGHRSVTETARGIRIGPDNQRQARVVERGDPLREVPGLTRPRRLRRHHIEMRATTRIDAAAAFRGVTVAITATRRCLAIGSSIAVGRSGPRSRGWPSHGLPSRGIVQSAVTHRWDVERPEAEAVCESNDIVAATAGADRSGPTAPRGAAPTSAPPATSLEGAARGPCPPQLSVAQPCQRAQLVHAPASHVDVPADHHQPADGLVSGRRTRHDHCRASLRTTRRAHASPRADPRRPGFRATQRRGNLPGGSSTRRGAQALDTDTRTAKVRPAFDAEPRTWPYPIPQ